MIEPFAWTVAMLRLYGKKIELVPPCHELPTIKHTREDPTKMELRGFPRKTGTTRANTSFNAWIPKESND